MTTDGLPGDAAAAAHAALARLHRFGGDALVRDMVAIFREDGPARLLAARRALATGDRDALARCLHALRASAAQLGAVEVRRECADAERAIRSADMPALPGTLDRVGAALDGYLAWLQREVAPAEQVDDGVRLRPDDGGERPPGELRA